MENVRIEASEEIKTPAQFREAERNRLDMPAVAVPAETDPAPEKRETDVRDRVPPPPTGLERLKWLGPGLLWMLSSVGAGSVLFTPRVGSRYQYDLLWIPLLIFIFMWVMIREAGRYTVVSGKTLLEGYNALPGPRGWAVWIIFVPQLIAAAVSIAGVGALVGSDLMIAFPGTHMLFAVAPILVSCALVVSGHYSGVERVSQALAFLLVTAIVITAFQVFPAPARLGHGLRPHIPEDAQIYFILPWVGYVLAGAIGITWFSYWVATRGYGGGVVGISEMPSNNHTSETDPETAEIDDAVREARIQAWIRTMSATAGFGVVTGGIVVLSFLILGTELLAPEGIMPAGIDVARSLTHLLSDIWGWAGYWLMIAAVFIALGGTILANQDGWGRTFTDATLILDRNQREGPVPVKPLLARLNDRLPFEADGWSPLKNGYVILVTTLLPLLILLLVENPVQLLSIAGIIAAAHTPVVVFLTLKLNRTRLPDPFRPSLISSAMMTLSGLFYGGLAVLQILKLIGIDLFG